MPAPKTTRIEAETSTRRVLVEDHTARRTVQIKCCGKWLTCDHMTVCGNCGAEYDLVSAARHGLYGAMFEGRRDCAW